MKNLKKIMIEYIKEDKSEVAKFCNKLRNDVEIVDSEKNVDKLDLDIDVDDSSSNVVLLIEIFLVKLEKFYFTNKAEKEIDRVRVWFIKITFILIFFFLYFLYIFIYLYCWKFWQIF